VEGEQLLMMHTTADGRMLYVTMMKVLASWKSVGIEATEATPLAPRLNANLEIRPVGPVALAAKSVKLNVRMQWRDVG
jgi:hypothetical protein